MGGGGGIDAAITRPPLMKMLPPTFHQIKLNAGGLGPGTLVGSAAFDLFPIHVVCVVVPKAGELKKISDLGVWIVELFWSFWAYIWLYIILEWRFLTINIYKYPYLMDDIYRNPGPLQFEVPGADSKAVSLCVEDLDYMGRIKELNDYLDKVRTIVKPGCSQDVLKAALSAMSSVTDILSVMTSQRE